MVEGWTPAGSPPPPASPRPTPAARRWRSSPRARRPGCSTRGGWTRPSPCSAGSSATPHRPAPEVGVTDAEELLEEPADAPPEAGPATLSLRALVSELVATLQGAI